jgi:starch synthase
MHIVFAASECVPYAKTGGVAEVVAALPKELVRQGHRVTVYIPLYRQVQKHLKNRKVAVRSLTIPFTYYNRFVSVVDGGVSDGVQFYFIDCPELFDREFLYETPSGDYADNAERFGLFSRAVLDATKILGVPEVFHIHGWPAGVLAILLRTVYYFDPVLKNVACLLTIHNADRQGWFPRETVEKLLLPWDVYTAERAEFYGTFDFLKGGIVYSDAINTVSRKYAEELQTQEYGNGLEGILRARKQDFRGILNGVDYQVWDPSHDSKIAAHYTPERLDGKLACRKDLLHAFGVSNMLTDETPVVGMVSRLATQKGLDLLAQIFDQLLQENMFLVILGTGEPYYENLLRSWQERHPNKVAVAITYDETLAHKVSAGADMILMPSRYEPCGLNQIYGMKYATVPVVRATGGLDDTVQEWSGEQGSGTGFRFYDYRPEEFLAALRRAFAVYADKQSWRKLMLNGMARDYSWTNPAKEYIQLYEEIARRRS